MKKLHILAFASATAIISTCAYGAAYRPALIHQVFPYDEVERLINEKARENSITVPVEVHKYLACRLRGEKVTGVGVTLSPDIGNLFSGQKFPLELSYLSEVGQVRTASYETLLDWQKLNAPHAYTLILTVTTGTERDFFGSKNAVELEGGYHATFPLPNAALTLTEIAAHVKESNGKVHMFCISLGNHSASNFLKAGVIAPQQN